MRTKRRRGPNLLAVYSIGHKLRTLRTEKGLTLSRLAAETKLSTALLSKLETKLMIPTLQTLTRIARVYGVDLGYFLCAPTQHSLAITRHAQIAHNRRAQQHAIELPLHRASSASRQVSKVLEIPAGCLVDTRQPQHKNRIHRLRPRRLRPSLHRWSRRRSRSGRLHRARHRHHIVVDRA